MRNSMYQQGRKRPRAVGNENEPSPPATSSSAALSSWAAVPSGLSAPARHYTSTQPDVEEVAGSSSTSNIVEGGVSWAGTEISPPLFTREELAPTYHNIGGGEGSGKGSDAAAGPASPTEAGGIGGEVVLGCPHYGRACKIRAPCCQRLFTCRLCHDQASDHKMDREAVKEMLCMRCGTLQPVHRYACAYR